jgi:hypothetical protein
MLRVLAFLAVLAMAPLAHAATYTFQGTGTCIINGSEAPCAADMSFSIAPASYGGMATVPYAGARLFDAEGQLIDFFSIGWMDDPYTLEDACTDWCAYAMTDAVGTLLWMEGHCFNCAPDAEMTHQGWRISGARFGWGNWSLQQPLALRAAAVLHAPVPPSLLMLLSALALLLPASRSAGRFALSCPGPAGAILGGDARSANGMVRVVAR